MNREMTKLAIHGGPKSVAAEEPALERWGEKEKEAVIAAVGQGSLFYWNGPQTNRLLARFREHYPLTHLMPCSSGTAAIHIALAAAGIGPGDEVILPPITDMGTAIGILYQQGVPIFADVRADTFNLDPDAVRAAISPKTKAIVAVHLAGNPCAMKELVELAREHNLVLIEDCAQAWGAICDRIPVGTIGDIGCFSLNDFKHISCGEGGVVGTSDDRYGPHLQTFGDKAYNRSSGIRQPEVLAPNYRISELQSAFAAAQLERVKGIAAGRARAGDRLTSHLEGLPGISPPRRAVTDRCTYWFYLFRLRLEELTCSREEFAAAMQAEGVPGRAGYIDEPLYKYPVFQNANFFAGRWPVRELGLTSHDYRSDHCEVAEAILQDAILIPISQAMTNAYIDALAEGLRKVACHYARSV